MRELCACALYALVLYLCSLKLSFSLLSADVPQVHRMGYNGSGVIMILDTGFQLNHPAIPVHQVLDHYNFVWDNETVHYSDGGKVYIIILAQYRPHLLTHYYSSR